MEKSSLTAMRKKTVRMFFEPVVAAGLAPGGREQAVDKAGLAQTEGGGEKFVAHGALPVVDRGRMRHCASYGPPISSSPGCARQGFAVPGGARRLTRVLSKRVEKRPSIEEIIDRKYDDLLRFVRYRIRDPAEVRDIAQEAFLRLIRRNREELIERPEAYLFRIAANLAHEHRLRIKRHVNDGNGWIDETTDRSRSPMFAAENQESIDRINKAFDLPPALPRAALLLQARRWAYLR